MLNLTRERLLASTMISGFAAGLLAAGAAYAQDAAPAAATAAAEEEVVVTGTRIQRPGMTSTSPVTSIDANEIALKQTPEVERILRDLPVTVPGDGGNVNNGTGGASTVDLRGLGENRTLVLLDGKRMTPYDTAGFVDVSIIPVSLLERVDIVTGGASAVYGSDAVAGAVNFILKKNFEGVAIDTEYSVSGKGDGATFSTTGTIGANVDDGRGNVTLTMGYMNRQGVQLGARDYGRYNVDTPSGAGLGGTPTLPSDNCLAENTATTGSGTTVPGRIILGTGLSRQFRNDGTLGGNCNGFNFNPFNYYQTPQDRYSFLGTAEYDISPNVTVYGRAMFANTVVRQQVAPSGVFGNPFDVPLSNPFISAAARAAIIQDYNVDGYTRALTSAAAAGEPAPTFAEYFADLGVTDVNGDGLLDAGDTVELAILRRTPELGERSTTYEGTLYQVTLGVKGNVSEDWSYDLSYSHGRSKRSELSAGYTNVANIATALDPAACAEEDACVPLNLFGGEGSITPEMAAYASATAMIDRVYTQDIVSGVMSGTLGGATMPWAQDPIAIAFGMEYRQERGTVTPDECWKLAPTSCLGGAGGNILPLTGGFDVYEMFAEAIVPIVQDQPGFESLTLEIGGRYSEYSPGGQNQTYKAGLNWEPVSGLRLRGMFQRAVRAPNVGELSGPQRTQLDNASFDPCSNYGTLDEDGNPLPLAEQRVIDATLRARCIATGMTGGQVGIVPDISAGQINVFIGTDPLALPSPEKADTLTLGMVFQPDFLGDAIIAPSLSIDYYRIQIDGPISSYAAQDVLDACYEGGVASFCSLIQRVNGNLLVAGSGVETYTTNLQMLEAEGIEVGASFGVELADLIGGDDAGRLDFSFYGNMYLTNEFQNVAVLPITDCLGYYGKACADVAHEYRWTQRTTYSIGDWQFSALWRHLSEVEVRPEEADAVFPGFHRIGAYDYLDLAVSYQIIEEAGITLAVTNVFDRKPPIIGNETGPTDINSGNTFPSNYDTLGQVFSMGINLRF